MKTKRYFLTADGQIQLGEPITMRKAIELQNQKIALLTVKPSKEIPNVAEFLRTNAQEINRPSKTYYGNGTVVIPGKMKNAADFLPTKVTRNLV